MGNKKKKSKTWYADWVPVEVIYYVPPEEEAVRPPVGDGLTFAD